jgi:hypothetical protein
VILLLYALCAMVRSSSNDTREKSYMVLNRNNKYMTATMEDEVF